MIVPFELCASWLIKIMSITLSAIIIAKRNKTPNNILLLNDFIKLNFYNISHIS